MARRWTCGCSGGRRVWASRAARQCACKMMSPDLWFLLVLAIKMAVAAAFVVTASFVAERAGALVAAMVMTLPVGAGPAYVLLALDHGAGVHRRQRRRRASRPRRRRGISGMVYVLAAPAALVRLHHGGDAGDLGRLRTRHPRGHLVGARARSCSMSPPIGVCVPLAQRYLHVRIPVVARRWFDIPLRAPAVVALLVGDRRDRRPSIGSFARRHVRGVSDRDLGSSIVILHPRIGGQPPPRACMRMGASLVGFALRHSRRALSGRCRSALGSHF